jgi:glycosyltransferase involved in cell wall biosynthesis
MMHPASAKESPFRVVYTGTLAPSYAAEQVLDTIFELNSRANSRRIELDYYGDISAEYQKQLEEQYDFIRFHGFIVQHQIGAVQRTADLLFLLSPDVDKSQGIIPGKLFEYMGSLRPIAFLGHPSDDVTRILQDTQSGVCLPRGDSEATREALSQLVKAASSATDEEKRLAQLQPYIRSNQAQRLLDLLS